MTTKELKTVLKQMEQEGRSDKLILNILYYLASNRFITKTIKELTIDDLLISYDNLWINNEIVSGDNIEEYEEKFIVDLIGKTRTQAIKDYKKILVLNYYKKPFTSWDLIDCKIYIDFIYDKLVF